jgi:hypothetical protein
MRAVTSATAEFSEQIFSKKTKSEIGIFGLSGHMRFVKNGRA